MIRKDPIPKLDVIGLLSLSPENAVGNYVDSKLQKKYFIKPPLWDIPQDIELLVAKNELEYLEILELQEEMLESAKRQRLINQNRIKDMYRIQMGLRDRFIGVNNFLRECESKKSVAEKKVITERGRQGTLKLSIKHYEEDIKVLRAFHKDLTKTVKKFEPYETVIQKVVEQSDMYKSVKDCIARCDALMLTQVELADLQQEKIDAIDVVRKNMIKLTNDAALTLLGMNNDLAELERSYLSAQSESLKWEKIMASTKDVMVSKELSKDRILDGIHQLYRLLCRRKGTDVEFYRFDIEQQLDFIKTEVAILNEVIHQCSEPH